MSGDPFKVMTEAAPCFSDTRAAAALARHFAIEGTLKPVASERDQNFHVTSTSGEQFVFKIANSAEAAGVTDLQNQALQHIQRVDPEFPVPRVAPTVDGADVATDSADDGRLHVLRVLTWLDGTPLQHVNDAANAAAPLGDCLARLDQALQGFEHSHGDYSLLWDIKRANHLTVLLENITDRSLRSVCAGLLQRFESTIEPALSTLRWQVIHNDLNPSNVLMTDDRATALAGVIDFGDTVHSPLIVDVAVATAYLCHADDDPFANVLQFLTAYTRRLPLEHDEIAVLGDLILMRKVLTILIANWRAARYPENRDYILRNESKARTTIANIDALSRQAVLEQFLDACNI